jgi:hypothetical protein
MAKCTHTFDDCFMAGECVLCIKAELSAARKAFSQLKATYEAIDEDKNRIFKDTFDIGNSEFIGHARTDIPALLAEVERLRAALEKIVGESDCYCESFEGDTSRNPCGFCVGKAALAPQEGK